MIAILALTACSLLVGLAIFQLALIFGAPLGKYAWGGKHTTLPVNLKIGSMISILLYAVIAAVILSKAELMTVLSNQAIVNVASWVIATYFSVGVLLNGISRSQYERHLMTPVALLLASMTILIALS